jgi:hypothetical protein
VSGEAAQRRIPIGPLVGLVGALLLLVSLFLDWWEDATAFTVFEVLDLLLAGLALAAIASLAQGLGARLPGPAPDAGLALPLAAAALAIVVSQMLNDPPAIAGTGHGPAVGMWIAFGGAMLMVAGSALAAARIKLALDLERREPARRRREPSEQSEPATGESVAAHMRARAAARAAGAAPSPDGPDAAAPPAPGEPGAAPPRDRGERAAPPREPGHPDPG